MVGQRAQPVGHVDAVSIPRLVMSMLISRYGKRGYIPLNRVADKVKAILERFEEDSLGL